VQSYTARRAGLVSLALLVCAVAYGQPGGSPPVQPPSGPVDSAGANSGGAAKNTPEMTTRDAPATFSTKVNLVLVPVVVRDRQARAVGTLRQEDFQLFDKNKPQLITKFSVEKSGSSSISGVVATEETPDETAAKPPPASGPQTVAERFVAYLFDDVHLAFGDLAKAREALERRIPETLDPSTRIAVYTTSGQVQIDFTDDRQKLRDTLVRIRPVNIATPGGQDCVPGSVASTQCFTFRVAQDVIRRMVTMPGSRSVVLVSPGFLVPQEQLYQEGEVMDAALRANVVISTMDARALWALPPGGDASQRGVTGGAVLDQMSNALAQANVLAELANGTGGQYFHNSNDLAEGFQRIAARPEFVYVLGFAPQNLKLDGAFHSLKVSVKNAKDLEVQARHGYYAPKHVADPEAQAKLEIQEAVFSRDEIQELPVDLQLQFFRAGDANARVSVLARVDLKHIRFRKADDRNNNTLTIVSGIFDRNGNFISGIEKVVEMHLRDQTLENLPSSGITVKTTIDVVPGSYLVRLVVRDAEGQMMAARNGVVEIK
jgi:VWFA-related protein